MSDCRYHRERMSHGVCVSKRASEHHICAICRKQFEKNELAMKIITIGYTHLTCEKRYCPWLTSNWVDTWKNMSEDEIANAKAILDATS